MFNRFFKIGQTYISLIDGFFIMSALSIVFAVFAFYLFAKNKRIFFIALSIFYSCNLSIYLFAPFYDTSGNLIMAYFDYNFKPLNFELSSIEAVIDNLIYNTGLFVPFGILIATSIKGKNRYILSITIGIITSFFVEIIQLLAPYRVTDIDDFIFNVLGTMIGVSLAYCFHKILVNYKSNLALELML